MSLILMWKNWAKKNGYTSLTQDGIIKTMITSFSEYMENKYIQDVKNKKDARKDAIACIELLKWYDSANPNMKDNRIDSILVLADHILKLTN